MGNFAENLNLGNRFRPPPVQELPTRSALNFEKNCNFVMIVIHIGKPMYPKKNSAERGTAFLKYRFLDYFWDAKLIRLVHYNYWYFVILYLTVSLYIKSIQRFVCIYLICGIF